MSIELGQLGVWRPHTDVSTDAARELEGLGYGAIWLGGSPPGDLVVAEELLAATSRIVVATGIVNIWKDDAATVARSYQRITARFPDRFLLGVGVGHPEATAEYRRPYTTLVDYLDALDDAGVPMQDRAVAALGTKVLALARDRSLGAHPYLTTPEHTAHAREILGPGVLLAPEQKVVLDDNPARARAIGRPRVANPYLKLSNYQNNLRRLGFDDADFAGDGSDRLIDALVAHGDVSAVAAGVRAHLDAGADHVTVQALAAPGTDPLPAYRELATAMG
ncbi:MAG: TIGR03620 family F420-dependent LLM class oxidoreductase [Streptosporangiales bacterium]|nr:TIGR03620 family F420-dependent LLM class oxidoreductase [Streptosporangiales bacterium]